MAMPYSRRSRFADGKSLLHRVEFAQEFETRLAGAPRSDPGHAGDAPRRTPALREESDAEADAGAASRGTPVVGSEPDEHRHVPLEGPERAGEASTGVDRDAPAAVEGDRTEAIRPPML